MKNKNKYKNIMNDTIFHITGGLGKHILASGVINSYKHQYPDKNIIVSSAYPDVFSRNPSVGESLNIQQHQYFYKKYILNKDVEVFAHEPYRQTSHILKKSHLLDSWCDLIGIEYSEDPSLHLNYREIEMASNLLKPHRVGKPILLFQPFGGPPNQNHKYSWARDINPNIAQYIVDLLQHRFTIIHICNPNHPSLQNVVRIEERLPCNLLFALLSLSDRRILMDSCLQHAAYAMKLKSIVFWGVTSPNQFGYSFHNNVLPETEYPEGTSTSYLFDYEIGGNVIECPHKNIQDFHSFDKVTNLIKLNFPDK